ncbi:hypothetical protein PG996_008437 [Apiospora saccharicola]|uniref:Uncharacterized protein n=1 Tax=Apiospora saccharicola TaxID=335842 RepID=A0ABR1V0F5_9PEZI
MIRRLEFCARRGGSGGKASALAAVKRASPFELPAPVSSAAPAAPALRRRDLTLPGGSHWILTGLTLPYPGQSTPDVMHLLHAGWVKSQTRHRLRHSQQCRLGEGSDDSVIK